MADFPAVLQLSSLDGLNGFRIDGVDPQDRIGFAVAGAGDVNNDGYADLVLGSPYRSYNGLSSGSTYVLYGHAGGYSAVLTVAGVDGSDGFRIDGSVLNDVVGLTVSSAGDVNNDGFDDVLIGGKWANDAAGYSYVIFGGPAVPAITQVADLTGTNGFRLSGAPDNSRSGNAVSSAGDVNGDGYDDLFIGAYGISTFGSFSGGAFVVFGKAGGFGPDVDLSTLDGADGFRIEGVLAGSQTGMPVASAGDVNGDGYDDLILGAMFADGDQSKSGLSYVVFGKASGFDATVSLADLDGSNGFRVSGAGVRHYAGAAISSGDINGDGYSDLIIGSTRAAPGGVTYVVYGKASGFAADLSLSSLDGSNGFRIEGAIGSELSGSALDVGDFNGDGYLDLIIGAYGRTLGTYPSQARFAGGAYVVFGQASGFGPVVDLATLDGSNGFRLDGANAYDFAGQIVSSAGDVNGDGVDDMLIASQSAGPNGVAYAGSTYVVFGVQGAIVRSGGGASETFSGRSRNDRLEGGGGNDILYGLAGDDLLDGGDLSDLLYGGDGVDDLVGGAGGDILYGDAGDDDLSGGDGNDKLFGGTGADNLNGGTGNDRMDGEANVDTLRGGAGNDTLDGGLGADFMYGGADNDIYIVDDANDQTIELPGEGYDIVRTTLSWTLADNVEALELQGLTNANGMGNSAANRLDGNGGDNILNGMAGVDTINGADGDDTIIGGQGNDLLRGGIGADTFKVSHALGTVLETDQIYDFSTAEGDRMDFSDLFAGTIQKVTAFNHNAGQMTLTFAAGITTVRLDIDGNGSAEYQVKINGDVTADWGGWLL